MVDTSVWIQHFRANVPDLALLLEQDCVLGHPLVVGELACGHLKHRKDVLQSLQTLPQAAELVFDEVLAFLESHKLFGLGLGWVDLNLLASARLTDATLWTLDGPLQRAAKKMRCLYLPPAL